jgi:hypothetical protein
MSNNSELVLQPGAAVTLRLDASSLSDCHSKADGALSGLRDAAQKLALHDETLTKQGGLIRRLGTEKADETALDALTGRVLELEVELHTRPSRDEVSKLLAEVREEIKILSGLARLLTPTPAGQ